MKKREKRSCKICLIAVLVLVMCWAGLQIFQYVNADIVPVMGFHWKVLWYEVMVIVGAYGLLGVTAERKHMKR